MQNKLLSICKLNLASNGRGQQLYSNTTSFHVSLLHLFMSLFCIQCWETCQPTNQPTENNITKKRDILREIIFPYYHPKHTSKRLIRVCTKSTSSLLYSVMIYPVIQYTGTFFVSEISVNLQWNNLHKFKLIGMLINRSYAVLFLHLVNLQIIICLTVYLKKKVRKKEEKRSLAK